MEDLGEKYSIRIGIIGEKASQIVEGTNLTQAELGAVHEFGATINHPGGTPYLADESGKVTFVSKAKGAKLPKTKLHEIIIPTRSFLRMPILSRQGKQEIKKKVIEGEKEAKETLEGYLKTNQSNKNAPYRKAIAKLLPDSETLMQGVALRTASAAFQRVNEAFDTNGFGNWAPLKANTLKHRYNPENPILEDTGSLKDSILTEVKKVN